MPIWKAHRRPDTFPSSYAATVHRAADGPAYLPKTFASEWEAEAELKNIRYWRWTIRRNPGYHLYETETNSRITAKKICAPSSDGWLIRIEVKPILGDLLQSALRRGK